MFASFFKKASHLLLYKMGPEIWEMYCFFFFSLRQPFTILSKMCSIKL